MIDCQFWAVPFCQAKPGRIVTAADKPAKELKNAAHGSGLAGQPVPMLLKKGRGSGVAGSVPGRAMGPFTHQ